MKYHTSNKNVIDSKTIFETYQNFKVNPFSVFNYISYYIIKSKQLFST